MNFRKLEIRVIPLLLLPVSKHLKIIKASNNLIHIYGAIICKLFNYYLSDIIRKWIISQLYQYHSI